MGKVLFCYAEGRSNGRWEAICLNYDIAVEGNSLAAVIEDLKSATNDYLSYVDTLPSAERSRLLKRVVPLGVKLKFIYWAVMAIFFNRQNEPLQRAEFTLPCPA